MLLRPALVAASWRVTPKTVLAWIQSGELPALRLPSGHFRLRAEEVRTFCQKKGLPLPAALHGRDVLVVGDRRKLGPSMRGVRARYEPHAYRALARTLLDGPAAIVVDGSRAEAHGFLEGVSEAALRTPIIVCEAAARNRFSKVDQVLTRREREDLRRAVTTLLERDPK